MRRGNVVLAATLCLVGIGCSESKDRSNTGNTMANYQFLEDALKPARLASLSKSAPKGSGGPAVELPDGSRTTRDVIVAALDDVVARGAEICPALVSALADSRVHIRYGAFLALQKLTDEQDLGFRPFQPPDSSENVQARERWRSRCE